MADLISWNTCLWAVSNTHFNAAYANIAFLVVAMLFFIAFYTWEFLYSRSESLQARYSVERAEKIGRTLLFGGVLSVAAFLIWFVFFFKPDAVQMQVDAIQKMMAAKDFNFIDYTV